ncbi:hypothetical protein F2Q69_00048462 [Brassica cretica]|uniref:RRM domain-containing protein n=1 Tax=Brassica cretica TaxID=69181 RepID=A0A8S9PNZ2_BRACR|nr:hypothetical protein F2Q69_00048462 [Brassica cretica]
MAFLYTLLTDLKLMSVDMLIIDEKPQISLQRKSDVGTNLFIGNLDPDVDEKIVYDTFSTFGGTASNPMTGSWLQVVTGSLKPLPLPSRSPKATREFSFFHYKPRAN